MVWHNRVEIHKSLSIECDNYEQCDAIWQDIMKRLIQSIESCLKYVMNCNIPLYAGDGSLCTQVMEASVHR